MSKKYIEWKYTFSEKDFLILVDTSTTSLNVIISEKKGKNLAKDLKAAFYRECSPLTREGVDKLLYDAVNLVVSKREGEKRQHWTKQFSFFNKS